MGNALSLAQLARRASLQAYFHATRPYRCWRAWQACQRATAPVVVLFYHRVADEHPNAWTISNERFERQIRWLRKRFDLVSLAEAQQRLREGNRRPAASITFDDGYADNCHRAIPLLVRWKIPCTYFVSTKYILSGEPFPHDAAAGRPLRPNAPDEIRALANAGIEIGGHTRTHVDLGRLNDVTRLYDEVIGGAEELAEIAGRAVRYFAFPIGQHRNLNFAACRMLREHGFAGVCSAYGGYNFPGDDPFHLQRIHGDPEFIRFKNGVTIDPRKLRVPRVYFDAEVPDSELKKVLV